MPDKMMRVAARSENGTARPLKLDGNDRLETSSEINRPFITNTTLNEDARATFHFKRKGFKYSLVDFLFDGSFRLEISHYRQPKEGEGYGLIEAHTEVHRYVGTGQKFHQLEFELYSDDYAYKLTNDSGKSVTLFEKDSSETLSNYNQIERNNPGTMKNIITSDMSGVTLASGEQLEISVNGEFANLELSFRAEASFISEVFVNYYITEGGPRHFLHREILLPVDTKLSGTVVFPNYGNHAEIVIRNRSESEQKILSYFVASVPSVGGNNSTFKLEQTALEISEKLDNLKIENEQHIELRNTKEPNSLLKFSKSPLDIDIATIGYDDYFYVIDSDGVLKKYEDIKTDNEPVEIGITLDKSIYDNGAYYDGIQRIIVMPEGITIFCTLNETANIYHLDDMNSVPELVFKSDDGIWWRLFGIDSYHNGVESFIMAGVYGWGEVDREVVLSTDGGKSFETIKLTTNNDTGPNSHWHDVAIDPYHGMLWATEGDGPLNRDIYYSHDLGETWVTIPSDMQPTTIIPFSDKIILGRDSDLVGIDVIPMHRTVEELRSLKPQTLQEFKDWEAYPYYASSPIQKGTEAYMSFYLYRDSTVPTVVGSGDSGSTWHTLFMGLKPNQQQLFAIDDEFIYAYSDQGVVYAKKPNWV